MVTTYINYVLRASVPRVARRGKNALDRTMLTAHRQGCVISIAGIDSDDCNVAGVTVNRTPPKFSIDRHLAIVAGSHSNRRARRAILARELEHVIVSFVLAIG
jgi:hypothetical protein